MLHFIVQLYVGSICVSYIIDLSRFLESLRQPYSQVIRAFPEGSRSVTVESSAARKIATVVKMCVEKRAMDKCKNLNKTVARRAVQGVLAKAKAERRLICGLLPALDLLENEPDAVLFCMLTETTDATSHMHAVLLQAFCFENDIPVIQVDNSEKLAGFCGISTEKTQTLDYSCALVLRDESFQEQRLSQAEQTLTDFYECTMYEFPKPTINLPPLS